MDDDAYKKYNKPERGAQPGVYKHPDVPGEELQVTSFPQADAIVRQGWEYDRSLPKPSGDNPAPGEGTTYESNQEKKGK